jgi:hypothetical protein
MNVEIGAEATLFPEKEYINGISCSVDAENTEEYSNGTIFLLAIFN